LYQPGIIDQPGEKRQVFGCLAMADLSDELIPAGPWTSDRVEEQPGQLQQILWGIHF
jgi:hypothetical protein